MKNNEYFDRAEAVVSNLSQRNKGPLVELFDPRIGTDYRVPTDSGRAVFSSSEQNCVVIRICWARPWSAGFLDGLKVKRIPVDLFDLTMIQLILCNTGDRGFAYVHPMRDLRQLNYFHRAEIHSYGDSVFSYFPHNEHTIRSFLEEARLRGTYEKWIIGSMIHDLNLLEIARRAVHNKSSICDLLFSSFSSLGGMLLFDFDCGEVLVAFRRFEGDESAILGVLERIR